MKRIYKSRIYGLHRKENGNMRISCDILPDREVTVSTLENVDSWVMLDLNLLGLSADDKEPALLPSQNGLLHIYNPIA